MAEIRVVPSFPQIGLTTAKLIECLLNAKTEILTDKEMSACCGVSTDCKGKGYAHLQTAIRKVLNDTGVLWQRIPRAGYIKRCQANEVLSSVQSDISSVRRRSGRAIKKLAAVELPKLEPMQQNQTNVMLAQLGTIHMMSRNDTQKRLVENRADKALELPRLLEALKK